MLPTMLEHDRKQVGLVGRAGRVAARCERPGVPRARAGARAPSFETWDRICKLHGWPQTFA
jgi:hypothetical protein